MKYRVLFYSTAVALPLAALAFTGVQAATMDTAYPSTNAPKWGMYNQANLTDAQKVAIEQAQALRKQAQEILEKAGLPIHRPGKMNRPQLTDEQKSILEQAHALRKAGKIDEAKALMEKSGLPAMRPIHRGLRGGR